MKSLGGRWFRLLPLLVAGAMLAACQGAGTDEVLDLSAAPPVQPVEVVGAGPVRIAMFAARNSAEPARSAARDAVEGARLALNELGGGQLSLQVIETTGSDPAGLSAQAAGARLVLVAADARAAAALSAGAGTPPVIDLSADGAPPRGMLAFASDEIDSALEGTRVAVAAGQDDVAVLAPNGFPAADLARLVAGLRPIGARHAGTISYPAGQGAVAQALATGRATLTKAKTLVILGPGLAPAEVAAAIANGDLAPAVTTMVGNSGWPAQLRAQPVMDGALVAMIDEEALSKLDARYRASAGRPLTVQAAFAYDAVALAAGIVRQRGAEALSGRSLAAPSGFRGTTGIFRFRGDGSVERRHAVYRIENGALRRLAVDAEGF